MPLRIALVAVLFLSACSYAGPPGNRGLADTAWELSSGRVDGAAIPMVEGNPITLTFDGDMVGGTAACNSYFGEYTAGSAGTIRLTGLGQTEMACPPPLMDSERAYLDALARVRSWTTGEDGLTLSGNGVALEYGRLPPVSTADLLGTVWVLDSLVVGDAVASVAGERATLELFTDGSLVGSTGCRTVAGRYQASGGRVETGELTVAGDCPPELSEQDGHVVSVLEDGFATEVDGDRLTLVAGENGLVYRAEG